MVRETYVMRGGELVPKRTAAPLPHGPILIRDAIDPLWHPANGKHYDSKSQFRRATKAHGCDEIGNDKRAPQQTWNGVSRADVAQAIGMVQQGYRPSVQGEGLE